MENQYNFHSISINVLLYLVRHHFVKSTSPVTQSPDSHTMLCISNGMCNRESVESIQSRNISIVTELFSLDWQKYHSEVDGSITRFFRLLQLAIGHCYPVAKITIYMRQTDNDATLTISFEAFTSSKTKRRDIT